MKKKKKGNGKEIIATKIECWFPDFYANSIRSGSNEGACLLDFEFKLTSHKWIRIKSWTTFLSTERLNSLQNKNVRLFGIFGIEFNSKA